MVLTHSLADTFSVLLIVITTLIVSYKVSAYSRDEELRLLSRALENNYPTEDLYPDDNFPLMGEEEQEMEELPTEKRYARLSYNYGRSYGGNRGRTRFFSSRYWDNYYKPWLNLEDRECYRQKCQRDSECCLRYSKCDKSARVCYSCWYGHPCKTSRDCCQEFPHCNRQQKMCTS